MAQRRVGAGGCRTIATQHTIADALPLLAGTIYAKKLTGVTVLIAAQRAISNTVLWQLRVLAGWMPAGGTRLARAAAAAFERDNIVALAQQLEGEHAEAHLFDLGALTTAWSQIQTVASRGELAEALHRSPWGDTAAEASPGSLMDVLTVVWLRRLVAIAPGARSWGVGACALIAARILLVDHLEAEPRFVQLVRPFLGSAWDSATDLDGFRTALPHSAQPSLRDIDGPEDLWRAEARLGVAVESDGFHLLRGSLPGPDVVLGAIAVLAMDGWRLRAALAAASADAGEVLDVVA